jgi:peptidoglycan hydrolase CwlO-like protein
MTPNPVMADIDNAITALASGKSSPEQVAEALTKGIHFMSNVIDSLKEQNAELTEDVGRLLSKIDELETDQTIILSFLQGQGIDITYTIQKEEIEGQ